MCLAEGCYVLDDAKPQIALIRDKIGDIGANIWRKLIHLRQCRDLSY
jgi:hypothetical protein